MLLAVACSWLSYVDWRNPMLCPFHGGFMLSHPGLSFVYGSDFTGVQFSGNTPAGGLAAGGCCDRAVTAVTVLWPCRDCCDRAVTVLWPCCDLHDRACVTVP